MIGKVSYEIDHSNTAGNAFFVNEVLLIVKIVVCFENSNATTLHVVSIIILGDREATVILPMHRMFLPRL